MDRKRLGTVAAKAVEEKRAELRNSKLSLRDRMFLEDFKRNALDYADSQCRHIFLQTWRESAPSWGIEMIDKVSKLVDRPARSAHAVEIAASL